MFTFMIRFSQGNIQRCDKLPLNGWRYCINRRFDNVQFKYRINIFDLKLNDVQQPC